MINLQTHHNIERLSRAAEKIAGGFENIVITGDGTHINQDADNFIGSIKMLLIDGTVKVSEVKDNMVRCGNVYYHLYGGTTDLQEWEIKGILRALQSKIDKRVQSDLHIALFNHYACDGDEGRGKVINAINDSTDGMLDNMSSFEEVEEVVNKLLEVYALKDFEAVVKEIEVMKR